MFFKELAEECGVREIQCVGDVFNTHVAMRECCLCLCNEIFVDPRHHGLSAHLLNERVEIVWCHCHLICIERYLVFLDAVNVEKREKLSKSGSLSRNVL